MLRWHVGGAVLLGLSALPAAPDLKPGTVAAFNRYVSLTETQRAAASGFLWVDGDWLGRPLTLRILVHAPENEAPGSKLNVSQSEQDD